ncbi:hypothetical protein J2S44_000756 [Catenuloplanes niger]|uniref:Uncharacterized protein n=1 Tax=Catenuloplanes niger TaxID=587534 RepID=A0AAE3ZJU3_9ACTN|nr:hypothetical protein [Catenuloplanes niger]
MEDASGRRIWPARFMVLGVLVPIPARRDRDAAG